MAVYSYFEADGYRYLIGFGMATFWLAIAAGMVVKLIRTRRGGKIREQKLEIAPFAELSGTSIFRLKAIIGPPISELCDLLVSHYLAIDED